MGTTLNHYPTSKQIRDLLNTDELNTLVEKISDYQRTTTLAEYHGDVTPDMFVAWANFVKAVTFQYPDAIVSRDFKITRTLNREELEEIALSSQQSSRYYHPENYPLDYAYDDDTEKYVPVADIKS